jgi:hypothetical protein
MPFEREHLKQKLKQFATGLISLLATFDALDLSAVGKLNN